MAEVSFVSSAAVTYDLTAVGTNAGRVPEMTAREPGFVARNRIVFGAVTAPTLTNKVMNVLKLLKVPERTVVTGIFLVAPRETAGVTHNVNSKSVVSATYVGMGWIAYKSASLASTSTDANGFATATLAKSKIHTGSVAAFPADPASSPAGSVRHVKAGANEGDDQGWADTASADNSGGMAFPYGGFVTFEIVSGKGASGVAASSLDAAFAGVLDVCATGFKIPE